MFFNGAHIDSITVRDRDLWVQVMDFVSYVSRHFETLPKERTVKFDDLTCHSICRALAINIKDLTLVDGYFLGLTPSSDGVAGSMVIAKCDHSWLVTPDKAIIDPYPVGFMATNPVIVGHESVYTPFGTELYKASENVTHRVSNRKLFRRSYVLSKLMATAMRKLKPVR